MNKDQKEMQLEWKDEMQLLQSLLLEIVPRGGLSLPNVLASGNRRNSV